MDWQKVRNQFEKEMGAKLRQLPGHREVPQELFEFRSIISLVPDLQGVIASHFQIFS